ncbi:MAG: presqualene diphosphate synthase HpnD [Rhodospirillales bacterium]|jgi:presqualene diphosphate synthase|nr:presqualene diphosphate synthase HpnD [Rhodospirillales bacterium]MBT4041695.1 presqualene diphosphate synthase HpnD [Rhodospirillales bacterium]MBT4625816.1 presqualene diphosphate synthase HpnD [Rhodospirillales bacterium]MBT5351676.1 presqualene diphosphate synthase HpnD [Rhodospirillales bacterium]MBT5520382.1 presqualene diphosphate synthase HpnD [Rhodospirillales bacterium]
MGVLTDFNERIADVQAREHVRRVTRQSGSSFYWAMRRLDHERRDAMYAVYAFCREADDIADDTAPTGNKIVRLQDYRREVALIYGDGAKTPTGRALQGIIDIYDLDKRDMDAVIDGMMTDVAETVRITDMEDLRLYMDRVACSVGRLSNRIFGIEEPYRTNLATTLGEALQLTNILRDLDEDAARDRMYLPCTLLRAHGIDEGEPAQVLRHPKLDGVCTELAEMADAQFTTARELLAQVPPSQARPATMMLEAYNIILAKLQKRGWQFPRKPVAPNILERLRVIVRYGI